MSQILDPIKSLFRYHKLKMLVVILFTFIFAIWILPATDLSDIVANQVTRATGIYTQLDSLGLAFNPAPGIHADNLVVEPMNMPAVKVEGADVFVSLMSAILGKQSASAQLSGLFKGNISVDFNEGDKLKSGERLKLITLNSSGVNLEDVSDYLRNAGLLSLSLHGALNMENVNLNVDPTFADQPSGAVHMNIAGFTMPAQTLQTQLGPLETSPLNLGKLTVKANLKDGQIDLSELNFGGVKDGLTGKINGQIQMRMQRMGASVSPLLTNYKLQVDLTVPKAFLSGNPTMGMAFTLLDGMVGRFKKETANEVKYNFAASGMPGGLPNFTEKL